jgi:SAM-dependent methyltransferase
MGLGPVILSVRAISVILADGTLQQASPRQNPELFYGVIGGYGALGMIAEVELDIVPNTRVMRVSHKMPASAYTEHFNARVRSNAKAVFHNADLYPPHYASVMSQTWEETDRPVTQTNRLMALRTSFPLERYFMWAISETPMGKWRREFIFDPILSFRPKVHWRNYEASYDIAQLGTNASSKSIYALQEYFVPVAKFHEYLPLMREVLQRHDANMINISIRHAIADPGSVLAWAREEVFAFVMYYKQGLSQEERNRVAIWTRELIDAVLRVGGTYYLPYQAHATPQQFHRAYPRAQEFFALKRTLDPGFRFRNALWDKYYAPTIQGHTPGKPTMPASMPTPPSAHASSNAAASSEFKAVFGNTAQSDAFYQFLQNIFHIWPEDKFHALLKDATAKLQTDQAIYQNVQSGLPRIKPFLQPLTYALPALTKQKREMSAQTVKLLGDRRAFNGYLEIGSTGRYISDLRKHVTVTGPIYLTNDIAPSNSPGDMMERGQLGKLGTFFPLDYSPLDSKGIPQASVDLVTCYIGLHHCPPQQLDAFVRSIRRVLRPGGLFIMRDHDVRTPDMANFVSLVHTVFNLGLDVPWATNEHESKTFKSADGWAQYVVERGFTDLGPRLLQQNDPSDNTLMAFVKTDASDPAAAP